MFLHDNSYFSHPRLTVEFVEQNFIKFMEYPPILQIMLCVTLDFFLILKQKLRRRFHAEDEVDAVIKAYVSSIPRNRWFEALNHLKICLQKCTDIGRDYFEHL